MNYRLTSPHDGRVCRHLAQALSLPADYSIAHAQHEDGTYTLTLPDSVTTAQADAAVASYDPTPPADTELQGIRADIIDNWAGLTAGQKVDALRVALVRLYRR